MTKESLSFFKNFATASAKELQFLGVKLKEQELKLSLGATMPSIQQEISVSECESPNQINHLEQSVSTMTFLNSNDKARINPSLIAKAFADGQSKPDCELLGRDGFNIPKPTKGESGFQEASVLILTEPQGGRSHDESTTRGLANEATPISLVWDESQNVSQYLVIHEALSSGGRMALPFTMLFRSFQNT